MEEFRKIFSLVESSFPIFEEPERAAYCLKDSIGDDDLVPPIVRLGAFSCGSAALCGIGNCVRRQHTCAGSGAEGGAVEVACRRVRAPLRVRQFYVGVEWRPFCMLYVRYSLR